jgi:hypothetical protein
MIHLELSKPEAAAVIGAITFVQAMTDNNYFRNRFSSSNSAALSQVKDRLVYDLLSRSQEQHEAAA